MKPFLCTLILCFTLGCAHARFVRSDTPTSGRQVTYVNERFLLGLIPGERPPTNPCGSENVESVELRMNAKEVLIASLTLGIYVPQRVTLTCR